MKKHKMTGCARFFIALIIIAPLAYLGAAYYNGQDGIQNIKNFLGIGEKKETKTDDTYDTPKETEKDLIDKDQQIQQLKDENEQLRKENESLKEEVDKLKGQGE
jgi:cell division protein FtsB